MCYTYQYASLQNFYGNISRRWIGCYWSSIKRLPRQEYSSEEDVAEFCSTEYGVNFPMLATSKVRGKKANPFYKKLIEETDWL